MKTVQATIELKLDDEGLLWAAVVSPEGQHGMIQLPSNGGRIVDRAFRLWAKEQFEKGEPEGVAVLRAFNEAYGLEDLVYHVRESEGEGWEGPRVNKWSHACDRLKKLLGTR